MNVLITGGAGFIGCNLIRHIIRKGEVRALVNLDCLTYAGHEENVADFEQDPKYKFERVDLRDRGEVERVVKEHAISHVLHLAAESHVDRSIHGPGDFIQTNIVGGFNLLEACRAAWFEKGFATSPSSAEQRFLQVSTDEVYGSLGPSGYFTETTPYAPNSPYSASKASSDLLVRAYHHTYGMPTLITNCSNNYGPYQFPEKLIPVVIESILAERFIPVYGDGKNIRDWLYVGDHVEALWQVLIRGGIGSAYNIGGRNERTNIEIVEKLCDVVDAIRGRAGGASRGLIQFVEDRPGHDRRYAVDCGKIERELGWRARFDFEEGLRETVSWYLNNREWVRKVSGNIERRFSPGVNSA